MKKRFLLLIIWYILFFPINITLGADSSCPIESSSPDEINQYIKNIRTVITNVNNHLSENSPSESKFENTTSDISRILYQSVQWEWYFLDFDYYITTPLFNELPNQMKRDVELLDSETQWLRKYLKTITKWGYSNISIEKNTVCNNVENCDLKWSAGSIVWEVISNNIALTNYLKTILTSERTDFSTEVILLPTDSTSFTQVLIQNYWVDARAQCTREDNEFWDRIDKAIEAITLNNQEGKDGIKKWKEAWQLLVWAVNGETDEDLERKLLQKELARQWLSTNQQAILLQNLADFNKNGFYSLENNFITNTAVWIKNAWEKIVDGFQKATSWIFSEDKTQEINNQKSIWLSEFNTLNENEVITESIKQKIDNVYQLQNSFLAIQDYQTNSVIWELIDIHTNIKFSSKTLIEKCELAVKVCNSQWYWDGNCGTCKQ